MFACAGRGGMLTTATRVAEWCGGRRQGGDPILSGVAIDSRRVLSGDLFVALPGERANGHDFLADATAKGAAAALVSSPGRAHFSEIIVGDCEIALARLATKWRQMFSDIRVTGITGSNGKTTVKEMLAAICRSEIGAAHVFSTHGNMNNRLGLSLAVCGLRAHHRIAVLETGMDAQGELLELGGICRPHIALINNAQRAHLGGFASVAAVAAAKGELIETLPPDGIAVLNADDSNLPLWKKIAGKRRTITFGFANDADYRGALRDGNLHIPGCAAPVQLQVGGMHNIRNALAAAAAGFALSLRAESAAAGLESFSGVPGRMQFKKLCGGLTIIDDSYNANPDSLAAAFAVLADCEGEKFAALGDMLALGDAAAAAHADAVREAKSRDIRLLTIGDEMKAAGAPHFADTESLARVLREQIRDCSRATVLVKGSRGMRMERVVAALENAP